MHLFINLILKYNYFQNTEEHDSETSPSDEITIHETGSEFGHKSIQTDLTVS